uniref:Septin 5 n=1 Tax=Hucho hucho TaxID=62062 RepID=A0A4W5MF53_9TELE
SRAYPKFLSCFIKEKEYVGFATLPNQVHRKSVKKGFDFTLMVSTLVNSLFLTDLHKQRKLLNAGECISQTAEITKHTVDIEEKGIMLKLNIVDTPEFVDAVKNTECWRPIRDYMEHGQNRKNYGVHCCQAQVCVPLHRLRPVDGVFMKALQDKVNVVPLISKADCLTPNEIRKLKGRGKNRQCIHTFGMKLYQFPDCDSDEDEEAKQKDIELKVRLKPHRLLNLENQCHCDFVKLRTMLIGSHNLKDIFCDCHYENYRAQCIQTMTGKIYTDNRVESPISILPLSTPGMETEKLIKMKDKEIVIRLQILLKK